MSDRNDPPRSRDEWRVEVALDRDAHADTLSGALHDLQLDNEARKRIGGSVIVTRDGPFLFVYAWHEQSAQEAERVVKDIMDREKLVGTVRLMRWHPVAEEWKDAEEPLPDDEAALAQELRENEEQGVREASYGEYPWEVVIELPHVRDTFELADRLRGEDLPVKRRFRYLLVGTTTEEAAIELGRRLEGEVPDGAHVGVRGNPDDMPLPAFVNLAALKPGFLRDLGL
ncbi:MAG TPA: hypothetical protein VKA88_04410 [Solirubrobacterales bacterium]|nr:hypothetical protein [Solirubrobacterales bacterium]